MKLSYRIRVGDHIYWKNFLGDECSGTVVEPGPLRTQVIRDETGKYASIENRTITLASTEDP